MSYESNPFSTAFGVVPPLFVVVPDNNVVEDVSRRLQADVTTENVFMLYGTRGSGKTVALSAIEEKIEKDERFVVIDLNSQGNLLEDLVAKLYDTDEFCQKFITKNLNLSAYGIGLNVSSIPPAASLEAAFVKILEAIKKNNKRLLLVIDEASKTKEMLLLASTFNLVSRKKYPVYMILTGLPINISKLEDAQDMTFLRRAEHILMQPLNFSIMQRDYRDVFEIGEIEAGKLALFTKGYPFAYQVLGKILWNQNETKITDKVLEEFDLYMASNVYDKLWDSLTDTQRWYLCYMSSKESMTVAEILEITSQTHRNFANYRQSLINTGILTDSSRGELSFALPRFNDFVQRKIMILGLSSENNFGR